MPRANSWWPPLNGTPLLKARVPYKRAILATAHKSLHTIVAMLRDNCSYIDPGIDYDKLLVDRNAARWLRKLEEHGLSEGHPLRRRAAGTLSPVPFLSTSDPGMVPVRTRSGLPWRADVREAGGHAMTARGPSGPQGSGRAMPRQRHCFSVTVWVVLGDAREHDRRTVREFGHER